MASTIQPALVSFWSHSTDVANENFLCGGVFVAPGLILTVKHVFKESNHVEIWVRPDADSLQAYPISSAPEVHSSMDAALVKITQMPPDARVLAWQPGHSFDRADAAYTLNGYFEGRCELGKALTVHNMDVAARWYITSPRHPVGHSGSAVCKGELLWGIATGHYIEPTTDRGCVIAVHQLWSGWLERYLPPVAPAPAAGTRTPPPQPSGLDRLATCLAALCSKPDMPVNLTAKLSDSLRVGLQSLRALKTAHELAEQGPELVIRMTKIMVIPDRTSSEVLSPDQRNELRDGLEVAMVFAARLGIQPDAARGVIDQETLLVFPSATDLAASIALRHEPHKSWVSDSPLGNGAVRDRSNVEFKLESGEGAASVRSLETLLFKEVSNTKLAPAVLSERDRVWARGEWNNARLEGRKHCAVIEAAGQDICPPELVGWAAKNHISLLVLTGDDPLNSVFVVGEAEMTGRLRYFLNLFQCDPDWKRVPP